MFKTYLHFVRHGEVYNPSNIIYERLDGFSLSKEGRKQANITAKYLNDKLGIKTNKIISSPLQRALESASPFHKLTGLDIEQDDRIIESKSYFKGQRHSFGLLFKNDNWTKFLNPFKPSWGEPYKEIEERMISFIRDTATENVNKNIVCVSHQLPIFIARRYYESKGYFHNPNNRRVRHSSITTFEYDSICDDVVRIRYIEPN